MYKIIEKNNPLAVHCICDTFERAEHWINVKAPEYCQKGYFMDKTLTPDSFTIMFDGLNTKKPTYYDKEFAHLGDKVPANMQIRNEYGQTRWLAVTPAQIEAILAILNEKEA